MTNIIYNAKTGEFQIDETMVIITDETPISDWLHNFALRIVIPKSILQANRQLLIFKSYAEVMGLPVEILVDEVHFYCNEILDEDKPTLDYFNLIVEQKP